MSEEKTFFRTCPACGRKFEVHLVSKAKVGEEDSVGGTPVGVMDEFDKMKPEDKHETDWVELEAGSVGGRRWAVLEEGVTTVVTAEDFRYKYKCKHCGHEWSEVHEKAAEGRAEGYTGD